MSNVGLHINFPTAPALHAYLLEHFEDELLTGMVKELLEQYGYTDMFFEVDEEEGRKIRALARLCGIHVYPSARSNFYVLRDINNYEAIPF